jgi:GNAT superfamily N-acetyltransferase
MRKTGTEDERSTMAPPVQLEVLDFTQPSELARAMASLILASIDHKRTSNYHPPDDETQKFIALNISRSYTNYVLTRTDTGLIAAATVTHNDGYHLDRTAIHQIAVQPSLRRMDYGRHLLQRIAEQALAHGDIILRLVPFEEEFFLHCAFVHEASGMGYMVAAPKQVLQS